MMALTPSPLCRVAVVATAIRALTAATAANGLALEVFKGAGRCAGDGAESLGVVELGFGQCVEALQSFLRPDCVAGGGVQLGFFKTLEECSSPDAAPITAPVVGRSGECFLLNPEGPIQATLSWNVTAADGDGCPEGIPMRFSEGCETAFYALAKNTAGFDVESGFGPRLAECRRLCDEAWFKGGVNYPEFEEDCACPVEYSNKGEGMRACEAAGGKSCFENVQLTNGKGAKLDITQATFDCVPNQCMGNTADLDIFQRKKMISCSSIAGATGCKAVIECQDAPATTTTLAPPAPAQEGDADSGWKWGPLRLGPMIGVVVFLWHSDL